MSILCIEENKHPSLRRLRLACDDASSNVCLKEWTTRHIYYNENKATHVCRNCTRKRYAAAAGRVAGRKAVDSGQIKQFIAAAASPEARLKALNTARAKGKRAFCSKAEDAVYAYCCTWFGDENVKRWRYINRPDGVKHNVDLYIVSIKTFVEVDGVYWHGLDRAYELLTEEQRQKFDHDRQLDAHCKANNVRLIRITDKEVTAELWDEIKQRLSSQASYSSSG